MTYVLRKVSPKILEHHTDGRLAYNINISSHAVRQGLTSKYNNK